MCCKLPIEMIVLWRNNVSAKQGFVRKTKIVASANAARSVCRYRAARTLSFARSQARGAAGNPAARRPEAAAAFGNEYNQCVSVRYHGSREVHDCELPWPSVDIWLGSSAYPALPQCRNLH